MSNVEHGISNVEGETLKNCSTTLFWHKSFWHVAIFGSFSLIKMQDCWVLGCHSAHPHPNVGRMRGTGLGTCPSQPISKPASAATTRLGSGTAVHNGVDPKSTHPNP